MLNRLPALLLGAAAGLSALPAWGGEAAIAAAHAVSTAPLIIEWKPILGLSDAQAERFWLINERRKEAVEPLRQRFFAGITTLKAQVEAKAPDAEITATLDKLNATRKAIRAQQERSNEESNAILTVKQRAKKMLRLTELAQQGVRSPADPGLP